VNYGADLLSLRAAFKLKLPYFTRGGANQVAATEAYHSHQLRKSVSLNNLHDLAKLFHLTISI
jgi:hypothetical protein